MSCKVRAADVDPRRIPYSITQSGCGDFDAWLLEPKPLHGELDHWTLFVDLLPPGEFARLLEEMRESLWVESKSLAIARDRAAVRRRARGTRDYEPLLRAVRDRRRR
jgi:hypothetical protein